MIWYTLQNDGLTFIPIARLLRQGKRSFAATVTSLPNKLHCEKANAEFEDGMPGTAVEQVMQQFGRLNVRIHGYPLLR